LSKAAFNGHLDVVKSLVEQGADIHTRVDDALRWAAEFGQTEIVNYLKLVKNLQSLEL
jgi:ankyrin repeat protein